MRLTLFVLLLATTVQAQEFKFVNIDTIWHTVKIDEDNQGKSDCLHDWIYSTITIPGRVTKTTSLDSIPGYHNPGLDPFHERICAKCLRHEIQRGTIKQKRITLKPTFEDLKKRLK